MSPQAGWLSCQFHQFQGFTQLINQAPVDEGIANPALDVKCVRLIVEDLLEVLLQVGEADFVVTLGRMNLRDPLNLPAPLLPIALHEPHWFLEGVGKQSIDALFFAQLPGVQDPLVRLVFQHQATHISQIARMRTAAHLVAAQEQACHIERPELANGKALMKGLGHGYR
jgi:hypothetical protein